MGEFYLKCGTQCMQQYRDPAGLCVVVYEHKVFGLRLLPAELKSVVSVVPCVYL